MIEYTGDASGSIRYTAKDGTVVTKNRFDPEYDDILNRLNSIQNASRQNAINRLNYEQSVKNAQMSIDAGRGDTAPAVLPKPECEFWPDDYTQPGHTIPWNPPLLEILPFKGIASGSMVSAPPHPEVIQKLDAIQNAPPHPDIMLKLMEIFELLLSHGDQLTAMGLRIADSVSEGSAPDNSGKKKK